ncbi:adenosylcobinamide-GDP ribazoletransferase [Gordonia hankookensis]|uniref:Adenosylcobinamide-GDP ribazoletransferase n=1 Tax=Gordonia hankookensis TaxID=589403 RepID=A0ABR7W5P7_9ACTN|nr:adenosylcobinamide-GDP ribazoletransferase [Gordonia hankookensis]MBD1318155.1 adenosylcobinamide-GDP ribazoletransferase [Gordonia hankookensis]
MHTPLRAVHVALSWLTVLPVPQPRVTMDRAVGGAVMSAVPVVGAVLGVLAAGVAALLSVTDLPDTMIGAIVVVVLALLTRGMHLDGLADTADGLGCYGPPERVAEVMRSGSAGPFGVATIVAVMLIQSVGFGVLAGEHRWYDIGFAIALGRLIAVVGARRGLPAAHPEGFGALVANSQRRSVAVWSGLAIVGALATGWRADGFSTAQAVQSVIVAGAVVACGWWFTRHCARRIGGISGDILGAGIELGVTLSVVGLLV